MEDLQNLELDIPFPKSKITKNKWNFSKQKLKTKLKKFIKEIKFTYINILK